MLCDIFEVESAAKESEYIYTLGYHSYNNHNFVS
jgi:hypothetical protein